RRVLFRSPGFPDAESIRTLRYFGINHVLVAADWATPERAEQLERWKAIVVPELATSEMTIYAVGAGPWAINRPLRDGELVVLGARIPSDLHRQVRVHCVRRSVRVQDFPSRPRQPRPSA